MQSNDLITQLLPRAQRLNLVDPTTGFIDRDEVLTYMQAAIRYLANRYQLQHFLRMNHELFRTANNVESYQITNNYGFQYPQNTRQSGFALTNTDGTSLSNLEYYEPARYNLVRSSTTGRPAWFTLIENLMYLQPTPNAIYIVEAIDRPAQDGVDIPEPYVEMVQAETLYRMAADLGKLNQSLIDDRIQMTRTVVNGEQRQRQRFFTSSERHRG